MSDVLIEHSATIHCVDGTTLTVRPHQDTEDGLFEIIFNDGDRETKMCLFPEMALALSSVITRVVSLNAKANP